MSLLKEGDLIESNGSLQANFIRQTLVLSERSFKNMHRDLGYYWLRLAIYIALGFGLGTVFYQIGYGFGSINVRLPLAYYFGLSIN